MSGKCQVSSNPPVIPLQPLLAAPEGEAMHNVGAYMYLTSVHGCVVRIYIRVMQKT